MSDEWTDAIDRINARLAAEQGPTSKHGLLPSMMPDREPSVPECSGRRDAARGVRRREGSTSSEDESKEGKGRMNVYRIDDGANHWVIAHDVPDALVVWVEHLRSQGMSNEEIEPDDDGIEVFALTAEQAQATPFYEDDPSNQIGTMQSEYERDGSRRYVGCSEW